MRQKLLALAIPAILTVLTVAAISSPVFAQDATTPATRADDRRQQIDQRQQEGQQQLEERRAQVEARRSEKQKQIIDRMKQKLTAVIDRLNNVASRLRNHAAKIRARAEELSANRGADVSAVESALTEAERHIGLAETEIANVKSQLAELDATDKPRDVAQTFRTGVQSVHSHFKDARTNLVAALKALREAAKESRPTEAAE